MVFSYHGEFSRFQVSKYIEYSEYTGCISLYIYCLITCNIKSLLNVPKISQISRKNSQVSRFPAKSPDSRNKFVFLPKQPLLELSPPVVDLGGCMGVERVVEFILIVGVSRLFWSLDYCNNESRVAVEKDRDDAVREVF